MNLIYNSKYSAHFYDEKTHPIHSDWFTETEKMNEEDFITEMQAWLQAFEICKPTYLLDRCVDFRYPISPEEQIWMANLLNKKWANWGLKKYAHIVHA